MNPSKLTTWDGSAILHTKSAGILDIFTDAQRREAAASSESPVRTTEISPGPSEEQELLAPPWVSVSDNTLSSPPESPVFRRFGGRERKAATAIHTFTLGQCHCTDYKEGEGGHSFLPPESSRFGVHSVFVGTNHKCCRSEASSPLTQALSPSNEYVLEERVEIYGNSDPGRRGRQSPSAPVFRPLCPGLFSYGLSGHS